MLQELEVNFNVRVGSTLDKISQFKKKKHLFMKVEEALSGIFMWGNVIVISLNRKSPDT